MFLRCSFSSSVHLHLQFAADDDDAATAAADDDGDHDIAADDRREKGYERSD